MKPYIYRFLDKSKQTCRPPMISCCSGDKAAVESAARLVDTGVIEVWDGERLVARLEPRARQLFARLREFSSAAPASSARA